MVERRLLRNTDWLLLILASLLLGYGFLAIYSATQSNEGLTQGDPYFFVKKQVLWLLVGVLTLVAAVLIDYHRLQNYTREIYYGNLVLLLLVFWVGRYGGGAQRWIGLGPFRLQPSELAKVAVIITLAAYLAKNHERITAGRTIIRSFFHLIVPMVLVLKQPDLGTSLTFIFFWLGMLWMARARLLHLFIIMLLGLLAFVAMWEFDVLKDYQKDRIRIMRNPESDRQNRGYQIIQQKIAVGSGQLTGKGLTQGTQSQHHFIPEQHTDSIFSVIGEELGFVGGMGLLLLFSGLVIWRMLNIVYVAQDDFGMLMATGFACMFAFHVFVNIGMVLGLMPVTGLPLPFVSYGGSNLLTNLTALGLLLNIYMRRHRLQFGD